MRRPRRKKDNLKQNQRYAKRQAVTVQLSGVREGVHLYSWESRHPPKKSRQTKGKVSIKSYRKEKIKNLDFRCI